MELVLSFDGDDSLKSTAYDHCENVDYGETCDVSCSHSNCDLQLAELAYIGHWPDTDGEFVDVNNVSTDYLLVFGFSDTVETDTKPNTESFYIYNTNSEYELEFTGTVPDDSGLPASYVDIGATTIGTDQTVEFETGSNGHVNGQVSIPTEGSFTTMEYQFEQGKCYKFMLFYTEMRDGTKTNMSGQISELDDDDEDCPKGSSHRQRHLSAVADADVAEEESKVTTTEFLRGGISYHVAMN